MTISTCSDCHGGRHCGRHNDRQHITCSDDNLPNSGLENVWKLILNPFGILCCYPFGNVDVDAVRDPAEGYPKKDTHKFERIDVELEPDGLRIEDGTDQLSFSGRKTRLNLKQIVFNKPNDSF